MRKKYLGDSYDIVKHFWGQRLADIGQLFAHPQFIKPKLRDAYTALTSLQICDNSRPPATFGLLLDPDTGIPLPSDNTKVTASHAPLTFIIAEWERLEPTYMVCFDQSYHRRHELSRKDQRVRKMRWLRDQQIYSFYYVSHAPFMFMARAAGVSTSLHDTLLAAGIPLDKFEHIK